MTISPQLDAVHRLIIECHRKYFDESPTASKVQRLCYYAQGYALAEGRELFPEDFAAWQRGPTLPDLHDLYRDLEWRQILRLWDTALEEIEGYRLVREVVANFGRIESCELAMMAKRDQPWQDARRGVPDDQGCSALISKASMRAHFKKWWYGDDE